MDCYIEDIAIVITGRLNAQEDSVWAVRLIYMWSHTHWDREWYEPFEAFRMRLARLIDCLLKIFDEDQEFKFVFDGQTIVLEDYLAVKPENREKLKELVQTRRLILTLSCVKRAETKECLVIRFYNPTDRQVNGTLSMFTGVGRAVRMDLDENELYPMEIKNNRDIQVSAGPFEIVTIGVYRWLAGSCSDAGNDKIQKECNILKEFVHF